MAKTKYTPSQLAAMWGVGKTKILALIRSGELRAINLATKRSGRPRYAIDLADIEAFERARQVVPSPPARPIQSARPKPPPTTRNFF
jgi:hypothetical protein